MPDKVYFISNDSGFLMRKGTPKGKPMFRQCSNPEKAWCTANRDEAETKAAELRRKGYINKWRDGDGICEVNNSDHIFDDCLALNQPANEPSHS